MTTPTTTTVNGTQPSAVSPGEAPPLDRRVAAAQAEAVKIQARTDAQLRREAAWLEERREARREKERRQAEARKRRDKRNEAAVKWVKSHTTDLLFVPVIAVPAALSWSSMAAYGVSIYGPAGVTLPALSEGAMWAFAGATTMRQRENERRAAARLAAARKPGLAADVDVDIDVTGASDWDDAELDDDETGPGEAAPEAVPAGDKPLWHLRIGTVIFGAYAAALNFLHGMTAAADPHTHAVTSHTYVVAVSMALVSVAGVIAHQLVTAGPRSSKQERDAARMDREVARRELAVRRHAVRSAAVDLDEDGHATLVYEPGTVRLDRRVGRPKLVRDAARTAVGLPVVQPENPHPHPAPAVPAPADAGPAALPAPDGHPEYTLPVRTEPAPAAPVRVPGPDEGERGNVPRNVPRPAGNVPAAGDQDGAGWVQPEPGMTPADYFEALVSQVMDRMGEARADGRRFRPGYDQMTADTGKSLSWCEKAVGEARKRVKAQTAARKEDAARTQENPQDGTA